MTTTNMPAPTSSELDRFIKLLREMFQLDKPELDFGLYRIMHAKASQISRFMEEDLIQIVRNAFGDVDAANLNEARATYDAAVAQAKKFGAPDPEATEGVMDAKKALQQVRDGGRAETDIYDHLYRFFERYYDKGDFMSRRYYARESDSRAAPYAVPYDGREVYLHWANKDQYYIKSSEYLTNFRFDAWQALEQTGTGAIDLQGGGADQPLPVRFTIASAAEGEHNNVKAADNAKRQFIPYLEGPATLDDGVLVLNFEYKPLPNGYPFDEADIKAKYGAINKGQMPENWMADVFLNAIADLGDTAKAWQQALQALAPTDKQKKRTLLAKYIEKYTARNTMDYFIHKDLGRFLRRELDFYIKNEIMQLDDIERADAPAVESWLARIKVIREIGHRIIAMLAQLEDFQKKLWLKKKFVTETNYCITLDRVPEELYPEIVVNDAQYDEWEKLFAIAELGDDSKLRSDAFLKANQFLVLDTAFFDADFKARLLTEISHLDAQCDGVLVHSENFQALNLFQEQYRYRLKCIYIDPPYNTGDDGFAYKDSYKHSSWMTNIENRISASLDLMMPTGLFCSSIDRDENRNYLPLLFSIFSDGGFIEECVWQKTYGGGHKTKHINNVHEYIHIFSKDRADVPRLETPPDLNAIKYYKLKDEKLNVRGKFRLQPLNTNSNDYRGNLTFPLPIPGTDSYGSTSWDNELQWIREQLRENSLVLIDHHRSVDRWEFFLNGNPWKGDLLYPPRQWQWGWGRVKQAIINKEIQIECINHEWSINYKQYRYDENGGERGSKPSSLIRGPYTQEGTSELRSMFNSDLMKFIKPSALIKSFLSIGYMDRYAIFMDYFSGSGSTGHAVVNINREDNGHRKYVLVEMGDYFDTVMKPRIEKIVYSKDWKDGKPTTRDTGISHCFKYIRLESYEDTLNNLVLADSAARDKALEANPDLRRDYLLHYFLDTETKGSQSLLNIAEFRDPTAYKLKVKAPGNDAQVEKTVDLVETFNWLIGLWVEHLNAPQVLRAEFAREKDPELPEDEATRLVCTKLRPDADGAYWFRTVEGYVLKTPGDENSRSPVLVIWRKLTIDPERDNAALQKYLETIGISTREKVYDTIYVNGSHTLPNPVVDGETTRVQLLEEAFHRAMWAGAEA